jgi:hypothetical protein
MGKVVARETIYFQCPLQLDYMYTHTHTHTHNTHTHTHTHTYTQTLERCLQCNLTVDLQKCPVHVIGIGLGIQEPDDVFHRRLSRQFSRFGRQISKDEL